MLYWCNFYTKYYTKNKNNKWECLKKKLVIDTFNAKIMHISNKIKVLLKYN